MAKKRKTLPKTIDSFLKTGDLDDLKAMFSECEPNALYSSKFGSNIFSRTPLSREFAFWAKEQGADINYVDHYGRTPIFAQASAWNGDVQLLIDLGAEVNVVADGVTPLHYAAMYGRPQAVKALLAAGADVEARPKDMLGRAQSPLEMTLNQTRISFVTLLEVCGLLLDHGAKITDEAKAAVVRIGENFGQLKRGVQKPDYLKAQTESLQELYRLLNVNIALVAEAAETVVHDGVSRIVIKEEGFIKQYNRLWEYLVPPRGRARTAQGEAIRIVGKVSFEVEDNGGANWNDEFRKMLRALPGYFRMGNPLTEEDITDVERLVRNLWNGRSMNDGETKRLCAYAVAWVLKNPEVIPPLPADYAR